MQRQNKANFLFDNFMFLQFIIENKNPAAHLSWNIGDLSLICNKLEWISGQETYWFIISHLQQQIQYTKNKGF